MTQMVGFSAESFNPRQRIYMSAHGREAGIWMPRCCSWAVGGRQRWTAPVIVTSASPFAKSMPHSSPDFPFNFLFLLIPACKDQDKWPGTVGQSRVRQVAGQHDQEIRGWWRERDCVSRLSLSCGVAVHCHKVRAVEQGDQKVLWNVEERRSGP